MILGDVRLGLTTHLDLRRSVPGVRNPPEFSAKWIGARGSSLMFGEMRLRRTGKMYRGSGILPDLWRIVSEVEIRACLPVECIGGREPSSICGRTHRAFGVFLDFQHTVSEVEIP